MCSLLWGPLRAGGHLDDDRLVRERARTEDLEVAGLHHVDDLENNGKRTILTMPDTRENAQRTFDTMHREAGGGKS